MFNKNETLATLTKREYIIIEMASSLLSRPIPLDADGDVVDDELLSEEQMIDTAIAFSDMLIQALED